MLAKQKYDGTLSGEIVTLLTHDPCTRVSHSPSSHLNICTCSTPQGHLSITCYKNSHMLQIQINVFGLLQLAFVYNIIPNFPCLSLPQFPPLPRGLKRMYGVGKDVSNRDVRIEWQAISVGGKATHYTDCFAAFQGSQGQCHLSSVGRLHERSSRNGIHSLVWHYSSVGSSIGICISLKRNRSCRTKIWIIISF